MATASPPRPESPPAPASSERLETGFVLEGVSWETYESLLTDFERSGSNVRMTYCRGKLEFMSPANRHERRKSRIGRLIEFLTFELNIDIVTGGSVTFRDKLKALGLEPDECYWITNEAAIRERDEEDIDLSILPPPDLAIEVENTRTVLDRLPILASLGFPEIWRVTSDPILVGRLQPDGTYAWGDRSVELPFLSMADVQHWLAQSRGQRENAWLRAFQRWIHAELAPRHRRPDPDG